MAPIRGLLLSLLALLLLFTVRAHSAEKVLLHMGSVRNFEDSLEAKAIESLGYDVDLVSDEQFQNLTAADFAAYRALVFGDPDCGDPDFYMPVAQSRSAVWIPVVSGNVVIIGTDPALHSSQFPGGITLINDGINFVTSTPNQTGAYICLSCSSKNGPLPWLDPFGGTWATVPTDCGSDITILATSPALLGLSNEDLSGWGCSTHEAFTSFDNTTFKALAKANTQDLPYIVARGESLAVIAPPPPPGNPPPPIATTPEPTNASPPPVVTTPAPTTPAPTTPAPTTPAPVSYDLTESACPDRCNPFGPQPNRCCNAEGSLGICCPGICGFTVDRPGGPPGTTMATCAGITPPTGAPTTSAPTTPAPTTAAPTTPSPTTPAPTTPAPTTSAPTTAPTTSAPTTAPTTSAPTTSAPITPAPTSAVTTCRDTCNPLSPLPNRCCNADGSLGVCCPGRCGPSIFNADGTSTPTCQ